MSKHTAAPGRGIALFLAIASLATAGLAAETCSCYCCASYVDFPCNSECADEPGVYECCDAPCSPDFVLDITVSSCDDCNIDACDTPLYNDPAGHYAKCLPVDARYAYLSPPKCSGASAPPPPLSSGDEEDSPPESPAPGSDNLQLPPLSSLLNGAKQVHGSIMGVALAVVVVLACFLASV